MRVEVHETGRDDTATGVDRLRRAEVRSDGGDAPVVVDQDVGRTFAGRIDDPASLEDDHASSRRSTPLPTSRYSTAIRTATPLRTWSTTTDLGRSATSAAISTPRFIGPG